MADSANKSGWLKSLPNNLTIARMTAIPLLLILYPLDIFYLNVFCAVLFAVAAFTDFLDGYLARRYDLVTPLGKLLDPIADKMLMASGLVLLAYAHAVPAILAAFLICRDLGVSGLRLLALQRQVTIAVSEYGKWKTGLLGVGIFCLMIDAPLWQIPFPTVGHLTLWGALLLSLYSAWAYGSAFWEQIKAEEHPQSS